MTSNRQDSGQDSTEDVGLARAGQAAKEEAVAASDLEAAPASQVDPQGTSFYNPALTGSGTIMADGTYGAPLPDPNLVKRQEDPEITTELDIPAGTDTSDGSDKPTQPAQAPAPATQSAPAKRTSAPKASDK